MKTLYHVQVCKAAFESWLTPRGVDWALRGNFNTDYYGSIGWMILLKNVTPLFPIAKHWYKEIDHMDQMDSFTEVEQNWNELRRRVTAVADDSLYPHTAVKKMLIELGRNSHSLTDIYAHSNYVELLYKYYGNDPDTTAECSESGVSLADYITENAPTFSELSDTPEKWPPPLVRLIHEEIFTGISVPDDGPCSHDAINKDNPTATRCNDERYPGIFKPVMALAHKDVVSILNDFFEDLKENNTLKFTMLTEAFPGDLQGPGTYEKLAKFWSDMFDAWG